MKTYVTHPFSTEGDALTTVDPAGGEVTTNRTIRGTTGTIYTLIFDTAGDRVSNDVQWLLLGRATPLEAEQRFRREGVEVRMGSC